MTEPEFDAMGGAIAGTIGGAVGGALMMPYAGRIVQASLISPEGSSSIDVDICVGSVPLDHNALTTICQLSYGNPFAGANTRLFFGAPTSGFNAGAFLVFRIDQDTFSHAAGSNYYNFSFVVEYEYADATTHP